MLFRRSTHATDDELSTHLDRRLSGRARARVESHVGACADCRQALDDLRAVQTSLRALPRAQAGRSFALRGAQPRPARPRFTSASPVFGGVAAFAMVAFLFVVFFDVTGGVSLNSGSSSSSKVARPAAYDSASGGSDSVATEGSADAAVPQGAPANQTFSDQERSANPSALTKTAQSDAFSFADTYQSLRYVLSPEVLAEASEAANSALPPAATPAAAATGAREQEESDDDTGIRIAEAALAGVALVSAGGAFVIARRRSFS